MLTDRGLGERVTVRSAGLCTYELERAGLPADASSAAVAAKHGLDLSGHIARPLSRSLVEESDLVIVMETWQADVVRKAFRDHAAKVYRLRDLAGATDDADAPDIAGVPPEAIEAYLIDAERCLTAGLRDGPLARIASRCLAATGVQEGRS
jgi:protein-tyrosine-phosphatase